MISLGAFEVLMSYLNEFRKDLSEADHQHKLNRIFLRMVDVLTCFEGLPEDVAAKVEIEIEAMFDAAWNNGPIPPPSVPVIFGASDDGASLIVTGLYPLKLVA